jgi:hypothetical protein
VESGSQAPRAAVPRGRPPLRIPGRVGAAGELIGLRNRPAGDPDLEVEVFWDRIEGRSGISGEPFESGVGFPQQAVFLDDESGGQWIVVAGNSSLGGPGMVRAVKSAVLGNTLIAVSSQTLPDPAGRLGLVTSIALREDGKGCAMSRSTMGVFELADQDADGDGFFEAASLSRPAESVFRPPAILGAPGTEAQTPGIAGANGRTIVVLARQGQQQRPLALGTIPRTDDELILRLHRPLVAGETIMLADVSSGLSSAEAQVGLRVPVVYDSSPELGDRIRTRRRVGLPLEVEAVQRRAEKFARRDAPGEAVRRASGPGIGGCHAESRSHITSSA